METASADSGDLTNLLQAWAAGDSQALGRLVPAIYGELRRIAQHCISGENPGQTLQATALAHEAYLRLVDCRHVSWQNRAHFFAVAARQMRRILIDIARSKHQIKRGRSPKRLSLEEAPELSDEKSSEWLALEDALKDLEKLDPRKAQIVEMRYFGGLSVAETAAVLRISDRTVLREWETARTWLYCQLRHRSTRKVGEHATGSLEED
jgi:RNA polymerase sigma factor (TIGR02999 family)